MGSHDHCGIAEGLWNTRYGVQSKGQRLCHLRVSAALVSITEVMAIKLGKDVRRVGLGKDLDGWWAVQCNLGS
jgi:hypothetical protein